MSVYKLKTKNMTPPNKKPNPFSDSEIDQIRAILEQDDFVRKFWSTARTWVIAVAAVIAGITVGFDAIAKVIKFFAGR